MTDLGPHVPPPAPRPAGAWAPPQASTAIGAPGGLPGADGAPVGPARKRVSPKKLIRFGVIAVAAVVGIGTSAGWFGNGEPKVGDCIHTTGQTSFDVVDCGKAGAEYRITGIDAKKRTYAEFQTDDGLCPAVSRAGEALWVGDDESAPGKVYCAEPL